MICFLCGKEGHVSASCPMRPRPIDILISLLLVAGILFGYAKQMLA